MISIVQYVWQLHMVYICYCDPKSEVPRNEQLFEKKNDTTVSIVVHAVSNGDTNRSAVIPDFSVDETKKECSLEGIFRTMIFDQIKKLENYAQNMRKIFNAEKKLLFREKCVL